MLLQVSDDAPPGSLRVDCRSGRYSLYFVNEKLPRNAVQSAALPEMYKPWLDQGIQLIRESVLYNCVGLALAARRGWLWWPPSETFESVLLAGLVEDGFEQLAVADATQPGDLITYEAGPEIRHIAVVTGLHYPSVLEGRLMLLSKWGDWGEFLHPLGVVPEAYGRPTRGWRQAFPT